MKLIIDGYNVLKQVLASPNVTLAQIDQFVRQLVTYAKRKEHSMVLVFDGGSSPWPTLEHHPHVTVVFAGRGTTADDYIKGYVRGKDGPQWLLITSDRELRTWAANRGIDSVESPLFYGLLRQAQPPKVQSKTSSGSFVKLTDKEDPWLDELMEQHISRELMAKDREPRELEPLKEKKISKAERQLYNKLKKL